MHTPVFIDNPNVKSDESNYANIDIDLKHALESWRMSIISMDWLDKKGNLLPPSALKANLKEKKDHAEHALKNGSPIIQPILGIGLYDNIEIGSGAPEFIACVTHGLKTIPVSIRKSQLNDFQSFRADIE